MTTKLRMTGEERRLTIMQAAKPLFAMNGFRGTSVKDIAKAADVSEALLYKHFSSKEAIYQEILTYASGMAIRLDQDLEQLKPGAEKLILMVYMVFEHILFETPGQAEEQQLHERFLFNSFLEDGGYARAALKSIESASRSTIEECYRAAEEDAHLVDMPLPFLRRAWFVHHLAMALNLCHLPEIPAFEYDGSKEELSAHATLFALRGIGLTDEVIRRFYKPDKLKEYKRSLYQKDMN
ncbi:MAG: TetR/AcrR family transcriptional regulator [SAR324 cluster bacterium]|nr:TetR/AcrR family transcriptional regulator [SAR324 cluster bacterium]